jgi:hypothetical protein
MGRAGVKENAEQDLMHKISTGLLRFQECRRLSNGGQDRPACAGGGKASATVLIMRALPFLARDRRLMPPYGRGKLNLRRANATKRLRTFFKDAASEPDG